MNTTMMIPTAAIVTMYCRLTAKSAFDRVIAYRPPAENEIVFLCAAGPLTGGRIVDMDMRSAIRHGVTHRHVTLQSLVQISGLSNVDGDPTAVLGLSGINVIAWQRPESSVNGVNFVLILVAGLPEPTDGHRLRALRLKVTTE